MNAVETREQSSTSLTIEEVDYFDDAFEGLDGLHSVLAKTNDVELLRLCALLTPIRDKFSVVSAALRRSEQKVSEERNQQAD